jgi:HipA-like protein
MIMSLGDYISKLFKSEDQPHDFDTPKDLRAHFTLLYGEMEVGYLNFENGIWIFEYSDKFNSQNEIDVLVDFPKKGVKYQSKELWPFFAHRIPGLGQPKVKAIIEKEEIDSKNQIALLKRFGKKSITNPFELSIGI